MTIVNHECYVSLEVAKLLKEAGFDWEVEFFYRDGILKSILPDVLFNGDFEDVEYYYKHIGIPRQSLDYNDGSSKFLEEYSAPTLDVAQRWMREIRHRSIEVKSFVDGTVDNRGKWWIWHVYDFNPPIDWVLLMSSDCRYSTYEEAQEAGVKKALEIILEKEE